MILADQLRNHQPHTLTCRLGAEGALFLPLLGAALVVPNEALRPTVVGEPRSLDFSKDAWSGLTLVSMVESGCFPFVTYSLFVDS